MLLDQAREVTRKAALYARVLLGTGTVRDTSGRGAAVAAWTLARGASGPSAIFRVHGSGHPERVAFVFRGEARTFGECDARIDRLALGLQRRGLRAGVAAIAMLKNRPECFELAAALSRVGASGVTASWRSTPAELEYLVQHSEAQWFFFESEFASTVDALRKRFPSLLASRCVAVGDPVPGYPSYERLLASAAKRSLLDQEGAVIIYTSGTTGKPKGAVRRFARGQLEGFLAFIGETPMRAADRHLAVCPLYHSTGLGFAGMSLTLAATVYLEDFEPERFLDTIARERITTATLVPTMLHRLLALPDTAFQARDLRSLRALFVGGAQLPPPLAVRALQMLGPVLYNFYGATETGLVTVAGPDDLAAAPGTIGRPTPGTELRLLDEQGRLVPEGEVGELYARNSMQVSGYHADEAATQASLREGFFSVGDLARRDEAGRYHIVGRRKDMVISGGVNIYPAEVEAVLDAHPAVSQSAVVGMPDDEWGEKLRAFVVLRPGEEVTVRALQAHCRQDLAGPKVPREWVFLDALPSNATGKILKRELKAWDGAVERG